MTRNGPPGDEDRPPTVPQSTNDMARQVPTPTRRSGRLPGELPYPALGMDGVDETRSRLCSHLQNNYDSVVSALTRLQPWNPHVYRVDFRDGRRWVARVFAGERPIARVAG